MAWKQSGVTLLAAGAFVFGGAGAAAAQERINWTDLTNVEIRGNSVEKTRGCDGCSDAGATSLQEIQSDGGYVDFRVPEDWTYLVAGLASKTRGTRVDDIEFGIRLNGNGSADIVENGRYLGGDTEYQAGDTFRIEVMNSRVRYLRKGDLMATSRRRPTLPLAFDVGLGSLGASVANARISAGGRDDTFARNRDDRDGDVRNLDRNNDGVITRREWTGSARAFNDRDTNDDGRITIRELDAWDRRGGGFNDAVGTSGDLIPVSATERWTDTGLTVRAGDSISIEADGSIQLSGDRNDTAEPAGSRRHAPGALVRNAPAGMLIARIGNGAPFAVGARRAARAPASGRLYLGVNDDYLEDNGGQFNVMVSIGPR
jgi:hypothetical protein